MDVTYGEAFRILRGATLQVCGIARTPADNAHDHQADHHLGQQFLDRYAETLGPAGAAVEEFAEPGAASGSPGVTGTGCAGRSTAAWSGTTP
ncbi:hypothetical protein ACFVTC_26810 [Streptomyces sp. NPDC057950]|uniref:hypothetical protein n=1 Tax=Streptomyces sp. NPDC057950 TaxID=3346288 RepID=UPI0036E6238D